MMVSTSLVSRLVYSITRPCAFALSIAGCCAVALAGTKAVVTTPPSTARRVVLPMRTLLPGWRSASGLGSPHAREECAMENRLKRKLADGALTFCMGVNQARTPNITMIAAAAGFDAIYVDLEHNPTSLETASMLCVAAIGAGITPMVRIGSQDGHLAARVLDGGAQGLMVPHINSAAEAEAIVTACRFPPIGHRSAGGAGPALGYQAMPQGE